MPLGRAQAHSWGPAKSPAPRAAAPPTPRRACRCPPGRRAQHEVVGIEIFGTFAFSPFDFGASHAGFDCRDSAQGYLVLQCKYVVHRTVVALGPDMSAGLRVDQLGCDPHAAGRFAHAAFEHVAHAELMADLLDVYGSALVGKGRISRDDKKPFESRKPGDDILDHAIGKIFLLGIAAHILERQHGDGRFVGPRQFARGYFASRRSVRVKFIDSNRARNILELPFAGILKVGVELIAYLPIGVLGDAYPAGLRDAFIALQC